MYQVVVNYPSIFFNVLTDKDTISQTSSISRRRRALYIRRTSLNGIRQLKTQLLETKMRSALRKRYVEHITSHPDVDKAPMKGSLLCRL